MLNAKCCHMKKALFSFLFIHFCGLLFSQTKAPIIFETTHDNSSALTRLAIQPVFQFQDQAAENENCIFIDTTLHFQKLLGIGAAITDAAAETFGGLNAKTQKELLESFFDRNKGISYGLLRTTIHSSDFSSSSYTYIQEGDSVLQSFSIAHDLQYRIPLLKRAFEYNPQITLFASPWSPPAFMKSNNSLYNGGKLLPNFYQTWANYYVKFVQAYEKQGIPIWGLSIQNEPLARQKWESCIYTASEERDFLKSYLGPTLQKHQLGRLKIIAWDHNRDFIFQRANTMLSDSMAAKYIWGIGFHWYETWTGSSQMHSNVALVKSVYPQTNLMLTEACKEKFDSSKVFNWDLGAYYAKAMIRDLNAGAVAWTDWNIFLNQNGGPNHKGNFCFAPVHVNTETQKIAYTKAYYCIGHFSKFIQPGAKRVACSLSNSFLEATAFQNTDGTCVLVVLNDTNKNITYKMFLGAHFIQLDSKPNSIQTILF